MADPLLALQLGDKHRITTPVNWRKGDDVIVHPGVTNEEAKTLFPDFTIHKVSGIRAYPPMRRRLNNFGSLI